MPNAEACLVGLWVQVPGGPSVACSTATAAAWDAAWAGKEDPSGRAVAGVHDAAYASGSNGINGAEPHGEQPLKKAKHEDPDGK